MGECLSGKRSLSHALCGRRRERTLPIVRSAAGFFAMLRSPLQIASAAVVITSAFAAAFAASEPPGLPAVHSAEATARAGSRRAMERLCCGIPGRRGSCVGKGVPGSVATWRRCFSVAHAAVAGDGAGFSDRIDAPAKELRR